MRQILTVAVLLFIGIATSLTANAQVVDGTYRVEAGAVSALPPGQIAILVDQLIMGDESIIRVSDETPVFLLRARHVTAGNSTEIVAKGRNGQDPGDNGRNGPTIILMFENVDNVRGLTVSSIGGDGAKGTRGRRGSRGHDADCNSARSAGNGGRGDRGGRGGNAGNGGRVFLILPRDSQGYGISMIARPGNPGNGGEGGEGGPGGNWAECLLWDHGYGDNGARGEAGPRGEEGEWGGFRAYTVANFQEETLTERLTDIIAVLNEGGYSGDADALKAVLNAGGLRYD